MGFFDLFKKSAQPTPSVSGSRIESNEFDSVLDAIEFMVLKNHELEPEWTDFWGRKDERSESVLIQLSGKCVNLVETDRDLRAVLEKSGRGDLLSLVPAPKRSEKEDGLFLFSDASARQLAQVIDQSFQDHFGGDNSYLLWAEHA